VIYTDQQIANIRRGIHPDCALADPCTACGASEATGLYELCRRTFIQREKGNG
jgi:hypothetical protein